MSALEPGRLYKAKVEGASERLLFVETGGWADDMDGTVWNPDCITDARPLIVLDLGDGEFAAKMMVETLSAAQSLVGTAVFDRDKITYRIAHLQLLINQIEAQTKPARIPEPGLWGVVEATSAPYSVYRTQYVYRGGTANPAVHWARVMDGDLFGWSDLIDPTLIREGVS